MGNPLKDLSSGLARFIYAWLVPSATAVAVLAVFVLPDLRAVAPGNPLVADRNALQAVAAASVATLILAVVFGYGALPIYRVLEGYVLPAPLQRRLRRRQLREWYRQTALVARVPAGGVAWQLAHERLKAFPSSAEQVLATRLGNALKAMETYGRETFGLDSQTLWYELDSVAPDSLRRDVEDGQAGVDIFISALVHLALLAIVSVGVGLLSLRPTSLVVAAVSGILMPIAYRQAVRNVAEYRSAVQALINTGRLPLAKSLGLVLPDTFGEERRVWETYAGVVHYRGQAELRWLDDYRMSVESESLAESPSGSATPT